MGECKNTGIEETRMLLHTNLVLLLLQGGVATGTSAAEKALEEAQAKHESLQSDMASALDGISALGK